MERLLRGEVLHYHSTILSKEPATGGTWNWHQDYGYWYSPTVIDCGLLEGDK